MIGYGTLIVYAGQPITMQGTGSLSASDVAAYLAGAGSISARSSVPARVEFSSSGALYATTTNAASALNWIPGLTSIGGDAPYSIGAADLPVLYSTGFGGMYVPPTPVIGYGNLPTIVCSGVVTTSAGSDGSGDLRPLQSVGGDHEYGIVRDQYLPAVQSLGVYGEEFGAAVFSTFSGASQFDPGIDLVIVLTSEGTLAASFTADRIAVTQFLSDITGESSFAVTVELLTSLLSSGGFTDSLSAAVGDRAAVDGQVWVVNLATEASSQYDDFGFNSFFTHEGRHYGVASDGIYLLEGATDNGEVIESMVDFGINDCGLPHRKKITNVRIGTTDGADTVLEVTTDTGTRENKLERSKEGDFFWRARMPHVQQGVYWRFVLKSTTQFELNSIDFAPANLTRRF